MIKRPAVCKTIIAFLTLTIAVIGVTQVYSSLAQDDSSKVYEIELGRQTIVIRQMWAIDSVENASIRNDLNLILDIEIINNSDSEACFYNRGFTATTNPVILRNIDEVRDEYYPDRNYPSETGQCLPPRSRQPSVLVYDIPFNVGKFTAHFTSADEQKILTFEVMPAEDDQVGVYTYRIIGIIGERLPLETQIAEQDAEIEAQATLIAQQEEMLQQMPTFEAEAAAITASHATQEWQATIIAQQQRVLDSQPIIVEQATQISQQSTQTFLMQQSLDNAVQQPPDDDGALVLLPIVGLMAGVLIGATGIAVLVRSRSSTDVEQLSPGTITAGIAQEPVRLEQSGQLDNDVYTQVAPRDESLLYQQPLTQDTWFTGEIIEESTVVSQEAVSADKTFGEDMARSTQTASPSGSEDTIDTIMPSPPVETSQTDIDSNVEVDESPMAAPTAAPEDERQTRHSTDIMPASPLPSGSAAIQDDDDYEGAGNTVTEPLAPQAEQDTKPSETSWLEQVEHVDNDEFYDVLDFVTTLDDKHPDLLETLILIARYRDNTTQIKAVAKRRAKGIMAATLIEELNSIAIQYLGMPIVKTENFRHYIVEDYQEFLIEIIQHYPE